MDHAASFDLLPLRPNPPSREPEARAAFPFWHRAFFVLLALATVALDLTTKAWAEETLRLRHGAMPVLDGFVALAFAPNPGAAWSLLRDAPAAVRLPALVGVGVVAIAMLAWMHARAVQPTLRWGIPLVLGGAVGNLVDRIRHGYVVDFIDVRAAWSGRLVHWPTFHVADIAICVGVGLMLIGMRGRRA
jgi:lipoprotein signal peptidase